MSMPLPTCGFRWMTASEIDRFEIMNIPIDGSMGYVLEVDLQYPDEFNDLHSDFPLSPEHMTV